MTVIPYFLLLLGFLVRFSRQDESGERWYSVVSENEVRPNSVFRVHVGVYKSDGPVNVTASLSSPNKLDASAVAVIEVAPYSQLLQIQVPAVSPINASFHLKVVGQGGGVDFSHEKWLPVHRARNYYVEVTVDKDIYNIGDVVKFNALIVDDRMNAISDGQLVNATVYNEYNHVVKEWINVPTKKGFIWGEVQLDDRCHRGEHRIQVNYERVPGIRKFFVPDETNNQLFFDVNIELPTDMRINASNTIVTGSISANYKCGRKVSGSVDLEIKNINLLHCILSWRCKRVQIFKNVPIYGSKNFTFDLSELGNWVDVVTVKAKVTDRLTGRVQSRVQQPSLNKFRNSKIKIGVSHYYFVPEVPLKLYIAHRNDSKINRLLAKNGTNLVLSVSYLLDEKVNTSSHFIQKAFNYTLLTDQRIYVNVTPPKYTNQVILQISEKKTVLQRVTLEKSPYNIKDHEISIVVDDARVRVGANVTADIYTSGNINFISYDIIALRSKSIKNYGSLAISGKGPHRIEFPVNEDLVTYFHLIVYGVSADGVLAADQRLFNTQEIHPFQMSITLDPPSPNLPGSEVNVTIESKANSFVFLKAADVVVQNKLQLLTNDVLLRNWDLEWQNRVETSGLVLKEVQFATTSALGFYFNRNQLFQYLSLNIFTNADHDIPDGNPEDLLYRTPSAPVLTEAFSVPRRDFSTLWLWKNFSIGQEGSVSFTTKVPDRISVWATQLYGVDSESGLSVSQGLTIRVDKPLVAFIDLPPRLVRGEAVLIRVLVFQDTAYPVNVTIFSENQRFQILDEDSHKVLSKHNLTKEVEPSEETLSVAVPFLLSPLFTGPMEIKVSVSNDDEGEEDSIVQTILIQDQSSKLHPVIYDAKDAGRFGEESCTQPSVKVSSDLKYRQNEKLNISFQVNSMNDEEGNLRVNACVKYIQKEEADLVLEIDLPSGFEFSPPLFEDANSTVTPATHHSTTNYEIINNNSRLRYYFKKVPEQYLCLSVMAKRIFTVYNLQPAKVTAYTSFNLQTAKRARVYYRAPSFETI